jgi:hypothetical protein
MKKLVRFALLMLLSLTWAGCASQPRPISENPKVLIAIRGYSSRDMPYMTDNELGVMIDMLEDAGCKTWVTSLTYDPCESATRTITPDLLVGSVDVADFDALVLPCLAAGTLPASQEIVELVKEFHGREKVVAAQYGARYTLAQLDMMTNDQITNPEVLQEGMVITSGCCPYMAKHYGCEDGTRALIEKVITTLNKGE